MAAETATSATTATTAAPGTPTPAPNPLVSFTPILVVCAILYLLVIRPQQKQARELKKMVDDLKPGDRVLTQGGIYGTVVSLKAGVIVLKIADEVKVEIARSAVAQKVVDTLVNGTPAPKPTKEVVG